MLKINKDNHKHNLLLSKEDKLKLFKILVTLRHFFNKQELLLNKVRVVSMLDHQIEMEKYKLSKELTNFLFKNQPNFSDPFS
jgi:uncharacterized protein YrzB (UPF0473 family)